MSKIVKFVYASNGKIHVDRISNNIDFSQSFHNWIDAKLELYKDDGEDFDVPDTEIALLVLHYWNSTLRETDHIRTLVRVFTDAESNNEDDPYGEKVLDSIRAEQDAMVDEIIDEILDEEKLKAQETQAEMNNV